MKLNRRGFLPLPLGVPLAAPRCACGGGWVNPGNFIVADTIGIAVIPIAKAEEVLQLAKEQAEREQRLASGSCRARR